jgi:hypothetical protein
MHAHADGVEHTRDDLRDAVRSLLHELYGGSIGMQPGRKKKKRISSQKRGHGSGKREERRWKGRSKRTIWPPSSRVIEATVRPSDSESWKDFGLQCAPFVSAGKYTDRFETRT